MSNRICAFINAYAALDLESGLRGISLACFKNVDLLTTPGLTKGLLPDPLEIDEKDILETKDLLKKYDLAVSGIYYYKGGKKYFDESRVILSFKRLIDISVRLKNTYIITDTDEIETWSDRNKFYYYINIIGDMAAEKGIIICLDIHGDWLSNGKKALPIIERINNKNIVLNYCTGNVYYYGNVDPVIDIEYVLPFIARIHLKDSNGNYKEYYFPPLGDGKVDFINILKKIYQKDIDIIAELELEGSEKDSLKLDKAFNKSYKYLEKIFKKISERD